jgi:hypothetical protein
MRLLSAALGLVVWMAALGPAGAAVQPVEAAPPASTTGPAPVEPSAPVVAAPARLTDRVAVIGASISAGFNTSGALGLPAANLSDALRKMLPEGSKVVCYADTLLFEDPQTRGARQIAKMRKTKPTMIVAIDFPFWWAYGFWFEEKDRLKVLERGLTLLEAAQDGAEKIDGKPVPVLIALLPDTHGLPNGPTVPHALQTPDEDVLDKCNERLKAWAAEHEGVIIVPLLEDFDAIRLKNKIRLGGAEIDLEKTGPLMQPDGLHTTLDGLAFVASRCVEALVQRGLIAKDGIEFEDPYGVAERLRTEGPK